MATALITGITGQDGSYLVDRLVAEGVSVHGVVRAPTEAAEALLARHPGVVLHQLDLGRGTGLAEVFELVAPDEVYNLAALSSVARSWAEPVVTTEVNALAALRVFDTALRWQQAGPGRSVRVLQASSAEIFGDPATTPQDESTPLAPVSPYGCAKALAHEFVAVYRRLGLHASSVILYNHESPRRPAGFVTRKITSTVAAIAAGKADELALGDVAVVRDWGWAPDYVEAMTLALRHPEPDDYVIATGQGHTVQEFVVAAFARVGIHDLTGLVRIDPALVRPSESRVLVGHPAKAARVLGWRPTVVFEELVARMVDAEADPGT